MLIFTVKQTSTDQTSLPARICMLLKTQFYIFLGLSPFMLLFFQQSSISAPLVNLIVIPFVTLLIVPLCLLILLLSFFSTELVVYLCLCVDRLLELFLSMLQAINQYLPQALLDLPAIAGWRWLVLLIAVVSLFYGLSLSSPKRYLIIILALFCALPVLFVRSSKLDYNEFQLDILDVGQGLALVIRTRQHVMFYDLGPAYSDSFNAGEGIILPFLRAKNIGHVDKVVVSHGDSDHIGGLAPILLAFPAAEYVSSDSSVFPSEFNSSECREGQYWQWDGVEFQLLHPDRDGYSRNNSSCVLKVSNAKYSVLLTGDIEAMVERRLLRLALNLDADILIAPHHGSKTSSTRRFIEAVSPDYAVFSSGYLNQFKHPHPDIVNLYTNSGTISLNTAQTGSISWMISLNDSLAQASLYRESNKRFWRMLP